MKWKNKIAPKLKSIRYRNKFLWFPMSIREYTYWLEFITVREIYKTIPQYFDRHSYYADKWIITEYIPAIKQ